MASKLFRKTLENIPADTKEFVRIYSDILKRINYLLESKGYKQKDLARLLGKKESEISKWLGGENNLTLKTIAKLQIAIGEPIMVVPAVPVSDDKVWRKGGAAGFSVYVPKKQKTKNTDSFETAVATKTLQKIEVA